MSFNDCPLSGLPCPNAAVVFEYLDTEVVMGRISPRALLPIMNATLQCEGIPSDDCRPTSIEETQVMVNRFQEAIAGDNPPPDERAFELRVKIEDTLNRVLLWTNTLPAALLDYEQDNDPADFERIEYALGDYYDGSLAGLESVEGRSMFVDIAGTCRTLLNFTTSKEELYEVASNIENHYKDIYIGPKVDKKTIKANEKDRQLIAKALTTEGGFYDIVVGLMPQLVDESKVDNSQVKKDAEKIYELVTEELCKYFGSEATFTRPETQEEIEQFINAARSARLAVAGMREANATSSELSVFKYWAAKNFIKSHGLEIKHKEDPLL